VYNRLQSFSSGPAQRAGAVLRYQLLGSLASIVDFGMLFLLTEAFGVYTSFPTDLVHPGWRSTISLASSGVSRG
jgi:hypothetical protein